MSWRQCRQEDRRMLACLHDSLVSLVASEGVEREGVQKLTESEEKYLTPPPARWTRGGAGPTSAQDKLAGSDDFIPCYLTLPPVEDGPTREKLSRLVDLARGGMGWKEALAATQDTALLPYVTDTRRATFLDLLPLNSQSDILEIGPGLGQFTATLARRSHQVHALE